MQNFTTQEHQRTNQGNVVVENPGKTIAEMREKQKNRNVVNGVIISAMALTVILTGTMLGATTAHNNQLKTRIRNLEMQNTTTLSQRIDENAEQRQPVVTLPANNDTVVPTAPDTTNSRSWERHRTATVIDNLTRPYTGRRYYTQYYKPHPVHTEYISKEKTDPVDLPEISMRMAPAEKVPSQQA